jgi:protein-tyrosine phosphatase
MTGRIDTHAHLLPGVDDGCKTDEESVLCARALVSAGYSHAFCTPHVWPQLPGNVAGSIRDAVARLQARFDQAGVALTVLPGGEINLLWCWRGDRGLADEHVITYGLAGRHALFDFWAGSADECRRCVLPAVRHLQRLGLTVILGHPERVEAFQRDPPLLDEFTETGVLLQMNTWCLTDPPQSPIFQLARRLLLEGRYFTLGTDLHDAASMPPRIRGLQVARELVGEEALRRLTVDNPATLLEAEAAAESVGSVISAEAPAARA